MWNYKSLLLTFSLFLQSAGAAENAVEVFKPKEIFSEMDMVAGMGQKEIELVNRYVKSIEFVEAKNNKNADETKLWDDLLKQENLDRIYRFAVETAELCHENPDYIAEKRSENLALISDLVKKLKSRVNAVENPNKKTQSVRMATEDERKELLAFLKSYQDKLSDNQYEEIVTRLLYVEDDISEKIPENLIIVASKKLKDGRDKDQALLASVLEKPVNLLVVDEAKYFAVRPNSDAEKLKRHFFMLVRDSKSKQLKLRSRSVGMPEEIKGIDLK